VIVIAGVGAMMRLPVAQYPEIAPPVVTVFAAYPGADADTIAQAVAAPIEAQVNGVDNMLYMESSCSSAGQYSLSITFQVGTDPDTAQVQVAEPGESLCTIAARYRAARRCPDQQKFG